MVGALFYDAERMKEIEDSTIVSGLVDIDGNFILYRRDGEAIDAGGVYPLSATPTVKGILQLSTDAEVLTGTDNNKAVTPSGLRSLTATTENRGIVELATSSEVIARIDTDRAITPSGLDTLLGVLNATETSKGLVELSTSTENIIGTDLDKVTTPKSSKDAFDSWHAPFASKITALEDGWIPAIATAISSSGSTATLNGTTGVVTIPAGCTQLRLDGIFQAGYEYQFKFDLQVDSKDATSGSSAYIRMREGGVSNTAASYQTGGNYAQYNGVGGVYAINAGTLGAIGAVAGNGVYTSFAGTLSLTPAFGAQNSVFYFMDTFSGGSARGVRGGGYTPGATTLFDGIEFWWNGSLTGLAQGKIRVFKRKLR